MAKPTPSMAFRGASGASCGYAGGVARWQNATRFSARKRPLRTRCGTSARNREKSEDMAPTPPSGSIAAGATAEV